MTMGTRVLVTGSEGFIGKSLVNYLRQHEPSYDLFTIDIRGSGRQHFKVNLNSAILKDVISQIRPAVVVHLAGNVSVELSVLDPLADFEMNLQSTLLLLLSLKDSQCKTFVYATSGGAIYDSFSPQPFNEDSPTRPISPYGISKLAAEEYVRVLCEQENIAWSSLAISNCYGALEDQRAGVIYQLWKAIQCGERPTIYGRDTIRDFIHVSDVVKAISLAIRRPINSRVNISSCSPTNISDLLQKIQQLLGTKLEPNYQVQLSGHIDQNLLDNSKAKHLLGWSPQITLEEGLSLVF